ncbi:MAG: triose-phosphate isomerase [Synergistes sp.]|nr:triose-phosphate isomerase [Synergistes sp.]
MRKKFIAGNWKMYKSPKETKEFFAAFAKEMDASESVKKAIADGVEDVAFFVPSISLTTAIEAAENMPLIIGAENAHWEKCGAFTGEISVPMVAEVKASHVLIGHSERRHIFHETNEETNKKMHAVTDGGLRAVLCVGETLEERESGKAHDVIKGQFLDGLKNFDAHTTAEKVIIAYEPVWAIGTGKTASAQDAEEICKFIRDLASDTFGTECAEKLLILYGGSVKPENTASIMSEADIDGVLVGGASLKAESFIKIAENAL